MTVNLILHRRTVLRSAAASALALGGLKAFSQTLDTAKIYGGFSAGGSVDVVCRRLALGLAPSYASTVVVEPKPGAGGQLAVSVTKASAPDGKVMLVTPMTMLSIYPHTFRRLAYDPFKDLTPVSAIANFQFGWGVGPGVPPEVKDIAQFLTWAKANPGQANFGSPGAGSSAHFIGILLGKTGNVSLTHVAYRGSQPAVQDLIGGQVAAVSAPLGEFLPHLASGRVRLLGTTGPVRSTFSANVPTFAEQVSKNMVFEEQFCLFLPAGAPSTLVERLWLATEKTMGDPAMAAALAPNAIIPIKSRPRELAAALRTDYERWKPIVQATGFTADS